MDEELMDLTTEEIIELGTEDLESDVDTEEIVQVIEVETVDEINVEMDEAIGWIGGDSTRHYSLYGRDEADQHPITAITGLREELNDIEALDVVYSDERNQADYYLWEDENILQENRVGYFVSACSDINKIKMCTSDNDIFGVTVDKAGFIGAQSDIARDIKYGLVTTTGTVHVRCESSVDVGDYVVSNDYGYAQKNKNGFKVVGRHLIDGVEYAEITLVTPINRICELSNDVEDLNQRMDDAETNIVAAINVANAAYNKASEVGEVSEEAIKNALEALDKANGASEKTDGFEERLSSSSALAEEAKNIALLATTTATSIANAAVETSNKTLENVNNLIDDLEPITTWTDPETGNTGAEYFTTYVKDGVATKAEIQTVETLTNDNKSAIEKNAEEFSSFVSSVDKYSVGEYSQSYGLTHEQAKSILKVGMIYVPTKHKDTRSHSETFSDTKEINEFTPGNYYEWDGNDWIEHSNSVAFFSEEPTPSRVLQYWYIDSNEAPEGYEAHALYIWKDEQWQKVNILDGNVNNRLTSMIRQTADEISAEIVNARGSAATLGARITNTESEVQSLALWSKGGKEDGEQYNLATIKQTADAAGASVAQVAAKICGEYITIEGTWDITDKNVSKVYYTTEDKKYWYYDGEWKSTNYPTEAGLEVDAASIVTAINNGDSSVVIEADHIQFDGIVSFVNGEVEKVQKDIDAVQDASVYDVKVEYALSTSDTTEPTNGWSTIAPEWQEGKYMWQKTTITKGNNETSSTTTCIQGAQGPQGEDGAPGSPGDRGVGVSFVVPQYCPSESNSEVSTDDNDWVDDLSLIEWEPSQYIWYREKIVYDNGDYAYTTPRLDESLSLVGQWCSTADKTYIDGGKIYTGSITANQIGANAITAEKIATDAIKSRNYVEGLTGSKLDLADGSFDSKYFKVTNDGYMNATGGTIGGWELEYGGLYSKTDSDKYFGMGLPEYKYAFFAGSTESDGSDGVFRVDHNGYITANGGTIGGLNIDGASGLNFYDGTNDRWTFLYPSGKGELYTPAAGGTVNLAFGIGTTSAINFGVTPQGKLYATDAVISGTLQAGSKLGSNAITIEDYSNTGGNIRSDNGKSQITIANSFLTLAFNENISSDNSIMIDKDYVSLRGNVIGMNSEQVLSDERYKNSFVAFSNDYNVFFDALNPTLYKYNEGTSDRYHSGFIAQEVGKALEKSNIDTRDFAGLCVSNREQDNETWYIRYDEFIALNTWQIQKAKARITELEEKVAELEALIKGE